jgi:CBS domain-containing protein
MDAMTDNNASDLSLEAGDQLTPAYEHAHVVDAMRPGIFTCPARTPLTVIARTMATHHVHSVVVTGRELDDAGEVRERAWGIVTDEDLIRAADEAEDMTAAYVASTDVRTVTPGTPLREAAHVMTEERISHLVVVDADTGQPVGVLSSLDIAGNLAWARG